LNRPVRSTALAAAFVMFASSAHAQSRPLVTEDPETVPAGFILLEAGVDFLNGIVYPASGLKGNQLRLGSFGLSFGVSSIAEIQLDGAFLNTLKIQSFDPTAPLAPLYTGGTSTTSSFEDFTIGAKVRFLSETERRPAMAVRFSTRLPMLSPSSGLAMGTSDFIAALAIAKTIRSTRVATNVGIGLLGDPVRGDNPSTALTYGVSLARAIGGGAELVVELNGRANLAEGVPPVGTENRAVARVGTRFTKGPVRLDAGLILGVTELDPGWGATFGATWVFKAFTVK
jgi:hypothetical protein